MSTNKRILFYSHDTFGLGHIRRTQKIANTIAGPNYSILIACASPMASSFASQPGIEYLNLPGFTKQVSGEYAPRNLNMPMDQFVNLRASLLLSAVRSFNPDLVIVDKEPLGVKRELLPSLGYLRQFRKQCRTVCGFRDILDEKEAVASEWRKRDTVHALEQYYDNILIYGDREIFDFAREYDLPASLADKTRYTGYIQPKENIEPDRFKPSFQEQRPLVTFTLGGGGDGWESMDLFLEGLERGLHRNAFNALILSGPFAAPHIIQKARRLSEERDDVVFSTFVSNTHSIFSQSRLIVSMGGYNTMCEMSAMGQYPLILPRTVPRQEQLIRAKVFKAKGYCDYLDPAEINAEVLMEKISSMTRGNSPIIPAFPSKGLENIKTLVNEWLQP